MENVKEGNQKHFSRLFIKKEKNCGDPFLC